MEKDEIYERIRGRNVKAFSREMEFQCSKYSGVHIHKAHGSLRHHFFLYSIGEEETGIDTDMTYEELKKHHGEDFEITLGAIQEANSKLGIRI